MTVRILVGDALEQLRQLPSHSVQCCVTSPPYWGLRDYGVEGQIGLEKNPRDYIAKVVEVFAEVRRVLRKDGTLWVNMGDTYTDGGRGDDVGSGLLGTRHNQRESRRSRVRENARPFGLGRKQLVGMPWRLAFALQDDGWTLRSDIIWHKPNPMPESVTDRPTKAHEYLFLFARSRKYFYDAGAIAEPVSGTAHPRGADGVGRKAKVPSGWATGATGRAHDEKQGRYSGTRAERPQSRLRMKSNPSFLNAVRGLVPMRNRRDVWTIRPFGYKDAHFATFPPALAALCIKAGTSPRACELCGAAWLPVYGEAVDASVRHVIDWRPRCECSLASGNGRCIVLDPFGGSGTTGMVAEELGRDSVLVEISAEYAKLIQKRCGLEEPTVA